MGKYIIDYRFVKLNTTSFITLNYDISECANENDFLKDFKINNDYYKIVFNGNFSFDVKHLTDILLTKFDNIIRIDDLTKPSINIEEISEESGIRGIFAKLMMDELKNNPQNTKIIYKAINQILRQ